MSAACRSRSDMRSSNSSSCDTLTPTLPSAAGFEAATRYCLNINQTRLPGRVAIALKWCSLCQFAGWLR